MRGSVQHRCAPRGVVGTLGAMLVVAFAGCQDAAAPPRVVPTVDAPLTAERAAAGWDVKLLPQLPDDGNVFGPNRHAEALAINDHGTIVGYGQRSYFLAEDTAPCEGLSAFVYRKGVMIDPFARLVGTCLWNAVATDVNNHDEVVGWALDASGSTVAWVWSAGQGLRTLRGFGYDLAAFGINDAGTIVGYGGNAVEIHAMAWSSTGTIDLHPIGANVSRALDINTDGSIVGVVDNVITQWLPGGSLVSGGAVAYTGRTARYGIPQPAVGITAQGIVAFNRSTAANRLRPFRWDTPTDLPYRLDAPPGIVTDISDLQRLVGYSIVTPTPALAIPYTSKAGTATPLPIPAGFAEAWPNGVNRCGQVVGSAKVGASYRAVTWKQRGCD
jgi:uncharacterized membrane protein